MGARLPLCIVGGVLMIVSLFLPTLYTYVYGYYFGVNIDGAFYYWIFGFFYTWVYEVDEFGFTYYYTYTDFAPDALGIICMIIIIIGAILAFVLGAATENKAALVGGILGICGMIFFLIGVNTGLPLTRLAALSNDGYYFVPFIGFFVCITGSILALVGGTLEKY